MAQNPFDSKPPSKRRKQTRPPRLRSFSAFPTGPNYLRTDNKANDIYQLFFSPPPGFLTFTNSRTEWTAYVAIWKVLGITRDVRLGPFTGYPGLFDYQTPVEGGRAARGGQVVDFIIHGSATNNGEVAIRIQTERYHQFTDYAKHAADENLRIRLAKYSRVADLFESDLMRDPTGQSACIAAKQAIFGGTASNPLRASTARRIKA